MNISIKHNNSTISSYVISYERSHNICSGIGTLELILSGTYNTTISPHDSIDVYENGSFQVRYYVSDSSANVPEGTITLQCQDKSKYIVDYFIPTSYTIDYPSYTRTWIEKFLTEAGISYEFNTSSQGQLLSNYTQLGLTSAYDQVMMLLQMSGWYMYFDGNGKAIIGPLETDLAVVAGSIGKTDILDIKRITDDKMLRNRAVVWGQYDGFTGQYAYADVSVNTRWNYDKNDQRAVVISNSNIPNKNSAYMMANQLIKEFARPTIEKHITIWGARNYNLGEALRVNSDIWRGTGLITTFGVSASKDGLTTNVVLDERCPRLFGFFDFGDYVYVSTYGDGIWRKHIKFDPTWYNFSTGLTNLNITDLHINNGILGSVGTNGEMFRATDDSSWTPIAVSGLLSSADDTASSGVVNYVEFSGLMARAVVIDKSVNTVKFGIDNASGVINMGDYFMDYYSSGILSSGIISSGISFSGGRGWIVEYDPFTGNPVGGLGSGIYPISYSGNYNITVVDIENDGYNDYVSVATTTSGVSWDDGYNFGSHETSYSVLTHDYNTKVGYSNNDYTEQGKSLYSDLSSSADPTFSVYGNELNDERDLVWVDHTGGVTTFKKLHVYKQVGVGLTSTTTTSANQAGLGSVIRGIYQTSHGVYRIFHSTETSGTGVNLVDTIKYRTWDSNTNSVTGDTTVDTLTITDDAAFPGSGGTDAKITQYITIDGKINTIGIYWASNNGNFIGSNYVKVYKQQVDMNTLAATNGLVATFNFNSTTNLFTNAWQLNALNGGSPFPRVFQNGHNPAFALWVGEYNNAVVSSATILRNWLIYSIDGTNFSIVKVQETTTSTDNDFMLNTSGTTESTMNSVQLGNENFIYYARDFSGTKRPTYVFNGDTVAISDQPSDVPFYWKNSNIYPIFGQYSSEYIAVDGSGNFWWVNSHTLTQLSQITNPTGYTLAKPFSTSCTNEQAYLWYGSNNTDFMQVILKLSRAGVPISIIEPYAQPNFTLARGMAMGNYLIDSPALNTNFHLKIEYIDNVFPPTGGSTYLVLQRNGLDYTLIEEESYPIRLDISNNSPLLTVGSGDASFHSNFITGSDLTVVQPAGILNPIQVNDYRYTLLEPTLSGITQSGIALQSTGLFVSASGILGFDTLTYSGGFMQTFDVPSGVGTRIETSNYGLNGQYIFITTSGDVQEFYQKDPEGFGIFTLYSGLPQSRCTSIRLDDRI